MSTLPPLVALVVRRLRVRTATVVIAVGAGSIRALTHRDLSEDGVDLLLRWSLLNGELRRSWVAAFFFFLATGCCSNYLALGAVFRLANLLLERAVKLLALMDERS